jgi:hypothetical protein
LVAAASDSGFDTCHTLWVQVEVRFQAEASWIGMRTAAAVTAATMKSCRRRVMGCFLLA